MKIKKTMIKRDIAGETVLVPFGNALRETNGLFMLTETGSFIWDILPECKTVDEIADRIIKEYDAPKDLVLNDVNKFLDELRKFEII